MENKKNRLKFNWKREWFSLAIVLLLVFTAYYFYLSLPEKILFLELNFFIPSYLLASFFPLAVLLLYLYFIFYFKAKITINDSYNLRNVSLAFLMLVYFCLSLYAIDFPINLNLYLLLFLALYIFYLASFFSKYKVRLFVKDKKDSDLTVKCLLTSGLLLLLAIFFSLTYQLIIFTIASVLVLLGPTALTSFRN